MNIKFNTSKIISTSEFLEEIEERVINKKFSFMILINDFGNFDLKDLVKEIKSHFDIFIVLETAIPKTVEEVESYFYKGFHGLYFRGEEVLSEENRGILKHTRDIFPKGTLFLEYLGEEKKELDEILKIDFIPVLKLYDNDLRSYIREKIEKEKKISRYLKYIDLLQQDKTNYNLGDKLKRKILLETNNLRQKLMTKNIEDSFNSSGL